MTKTIQFKKYIAFNPSSSEDEYWEADTLNELVKILRWTAEVSGTLYKSTRDGMYVYENLEIFDLTKHPKLVQEFTN